MDALTRPRRVDICLLHEDDVAVLQEMGDSIGFADPGDVLDRDTERGAIRAKDLLSRDDKRICAGSDGGLRLLQGVRPRSDSVADGPGR